MGGLVNVAVRFKDDTVVQSILHTTQIRSLVNSDFTLRRDKEETTLLLESFHLKAYAHEEFPYLSPYDYGLIVFDFKQDTVFSMQDYTYIDIMNFTYENEKQIERLFKEKRILQIGCYNNKNIDPNISYSEFLELTEKSRAGLFGIQYDIGLVVVYLRDAQEFLDIVIQSGFNLSNEDLADFRDYIKEYHREEEEEEEIDEDS